jgi:hypothetical protein
MNTNMKIITCQGFFIFFLTTAFLFCIFARAPQFGASFLKRCTGEDFSLGMPQ